MRNRTVQQRAAIHRLNLEKTLAEWRDYVLVRAYYERLAQIRLSRANQVLSASRTII